MTLHVPFTLETKHPINKEMLMKRPTDATPINVACPEEVHGEELLEDLSVPKECRESQGITKAESRIIAIRVHRTVPRHPVVSISNAEPPEVGEDASELSRLREPARS